MVSAGLQTRRGHSHAPHPSGAETRIPRRPLRYVRRSMLAKGCYRLDRDARVLHKERGNIAKRSGKSHVAIRTSLRDYRSSRCPSGEIVAALTGTSVDTPSYSWTRTESSMGPFRSTTPDPARSRTSRAEANPCGTARLRGSAGAETRAVDAAGHTSAAPTERTRISPDHLFSRYAAPERWTSTERDLVESPNDNSPKWLTCRRSQCRPAENPKDEPRSCPRNATLLH